MSHILRPEARQQTSWRDDMVTAALCAWVVAGIALDAWAHQTARLETFFTPWHGVLYSGFVALMAWMAWKAALTSSGLMPVWLVSRWQSGSA